MKSEILLNMLQKYGNSTLYSQDQLLNYDQPAVLSMTESEKKMHEKILSKILDDPELDMGKKLEYIHLANDEFEDLKDRNLHRLFTIQNNQIRTSEEISKSRKMDLLWYICYVGLITIFENYAGGKLGIE